MIFQLSADFYEDAKIDKLVNELSDEIPEYFKSKNYSKNGVEFFIVIVCTPHDFKQRKRFDKKDNVLYWDVILNYSLIRRSNLVQKKALLAKAILESLPIIDKYKKLEIDDKKVKKDMLSLFRKIKWCD